MQSIKLFGFCLAVFLPISAFAAPNEPVLGERAVRQACSEAYFSQEDVRECLEEKAQESKQTLQQAEAHLISALAGWDMPANYINLARTKLVASGQSFAKYREEQCEFAASMGGAAIGSALNLRRLACITELNNRRAAQLRDAASDLN